MGLAAPTEEERDKWNLLGTQSRALVLKSPWAPQMSLQRMHASKGDKYILIKYLSFNFFPPQYKRIKVAMMNRNKVVSQIPDSSPHRILSHETQACISLRVRLIKCVEAICSEMLPLQFGLT